MLIKLKRDDHKNEPNYNLEKLNVGVKDDKNNVKNYYDYE